MAWVQQLASDRWVVHLASPSKSEITVEVHMSRTTAERIADQETSRIAKLNPERDDLQPETVGSAVLSVLGIYAANGRV